MAARAVVESKDRLAISYRRSVRGASSLNR
jgi:hypothetical protein